MTHSPENRHVARRKPHSFGLAAKRTAGLAGPASVLALMLVATGGCKQASPITWRLGTASPLATSQPAPPPAVAPSPAPVAEVAQQARLDRAGPVVTTFTFDILRVRVPRGLFSGSGKIWNHLETDLISAEMTSLLHRNGVRAARASADSWPPIKAILETEPKVQISQSQLTMSNGLPLLLELDQQPKDQILFLYRRDGTLAGAPWRGSTNVLRIEYGIPPADADSVMLEIAPEMRLDSPAAMALRGAEQWDPNVVPQRSRVVRELSFRVQLGRGQFLAVGPSSATRELPYIMGSLLFCEENGGEKFESMYFITPTVTRTGG